MLRLLHLGDLHLRARARARENRRFAIVVRWILDRCGGGTKPVLVFTGDITDNGNAAEFRQATALLRPLVDAGFTLLMTPGNHDVGPLGNTFYRSHQVEFQRRMLGDLLGHSAARTTQNRMGELYPSVHEVGGCTLIGVDSAHSEEFLAGGRVGKAQLEALDKALEQASGPTVVYVHHHPFMRGRAMAMVDREAFMQCCRGRVTVLLFGHRHVPQVWRHDPRWKIPLIVAAGKTTKPPGRSPRLAVDEIVVSNAPRVLPRRVPAR